MGDATAPPLGFNVGAGPINAAGDRIKPQVVTPLFTQPIEEQPAGTLVDAVALVARAVTAKIAYHQTQIDALRRALRPFNELAKHGDIGAAAGASDDAVDQLLAIARKLGDGGS